ncbi:centrobin isoform X2 [Eleutherodactylus coqui]|uniref:centrobin isoform X2 n=1 Tax=Eleutherodactylus coqui TaxID=57060 RepID=UPI0034625614
MVPALLVWCWRRTDTSPSLYYYMSNTCSPVSPPASCLSLFMALLHAFSLQDASLLSGIEPLPLSSPTSPRHSITTLSSPPPLLLSPSTSLRRAVSSEVTAQLYASLRRSQEVDEEEESEEIHKASRRTEPAQGPAMTSEVEDELSRRLQEGDEEPLPYISQMESLRCHLKNMLTLHSTAPPYGEAQEKRLEQQSDATSTLLSARPDQDLSPPLSLAGLEGLFPRYSTLYNAPLPDLQLRETLEKETARRKHLERHIQNLQNEMLELQQRVSVMLAADRRKDSMIQQLDQTLALVVGGWKQQELQREESTHRLRQEKEEMEQARTRDQETVTRVGQELAAALESLEREKNATKEQQIELQGLADEQTARVSRLQEELEAEEEAREQGSRELEALQQRMQEQQSSWEEREQELQEECRRVEERGMRELEEEKARSQQEIQKSQQLQLALNALQGDVRRLEHELQTSHRERDTLQMELNLEKARNESEKVRIDSEHKMRLEEVITERLSALHEESAQHLCTVREHHRKQLLELTSQHEAELCAQMSQFKSELQERERRHRDIAMDLELKFSRSEERCQELSRSLRRLESERAEMLSQLQDVMKSHWSQALQVLTAKVPSESFSSVVPYQQTETSEQWTSQLMREGVYGEETSVHATQGIVGTGNRTGIANRHLKKSTDSHKETDGQIQRGGLQITTCGSQHVEDGQGSKQVDSRNLTDSSGSDLINFSRIMDNKSQSITASSPVKEPSLRFMGDGAHMSNQDVIGSKPGVQAAPSDIKLSSNIPLGKTPRAEDATSLYNSGTFKAGDLQTLQEVLASETIRKYIAGQHMREPYDQLVLDKCQNLLYPKMTNFNTIGTDQSKNTSGHSMIRNQMIMPKDSSSLQLDGIHQALMGRGQQMPLTEKAIVSHTVNTQFNSSGAYPFTNGGKQPPNLRNSTTVQTQNDANRITIGGSSQLKEYSNPATHSSLDHTPLTIPNLSPISKVFFQGHRHEFTIPSAYQENLVSNNQPSHKVSAPEETFYPMQVEELSQSFSSQRGFFPLEPHPDGTMSTILPQTSPEHPFYEEPSIIPRETPSNWEGGDQAIPNPILQYYIRMLLDRTPGDPLNELDKGLFHVNPDMMELSQSLESRRNQPHLRSEEKEQEVSKLPTNPKRNPAKGPEVVRKEVLSNQRRPGPPKPLKRVSVRGGRTGIWK